MSEEGIPNPVIIVMDGVLQGILIGLALLIAVGIVYFGGMLA